MPKKEAMQGAAKDRREGAIGGSSGRRPIGGRFCRFFRMLGKKFRRTGKSRAGMDRLPGRKRWRGFCRYLERVPSETGRHPSNHHYGGDLP